MTRQTLVEALRVLHTDDEIVKIQQRSKRLDIHFVNPKLMRAGLLVIPTPTKSQEIKGLLHDTTRTTKTKNPTNN